MSEAAKAKAIFNSRREVETPDGSRYRVRRHTMAELTEHGDKMGDGSRVPAAEIVAMVLERQVADEWTKVSKEALLALDVEVFSVLFVAYQEVHAAAFANFEKALRPAGPPAAAPRSKG